MKTSVPGRNGKSPLIDLFVRQLARMSQMQHLMSVQLQQLQRRSAVQPQLSVTVGSQKISASSPLIQDILCSASAVTGQKALQSASVDQAPTQALVATDPAPEKPAPAQWLPMSSAQRRLYLLCQQPEAELSYHITSLTELNG
ncbi:MAG: hypothetical protein KKF79_09000, partial [Gammaproteobacteria bacterium]|nr:hypothetical protein [Gammaproteobacteria bacterium]